MSKKSSQRDRQVFNKVYQGDSWTSTRRIGECVHGNNLVSCHICKRGEDIAPDDVKYLNDFQNELDKLKFKNIDEILDSTVEKIDAAVTAQVAKNWLPATSPKKFQELAGIEKCHHTCVDCECGRKHQTKNLAPNFDVAVHRTAPHDCQGEDPERCVLQEHGHGLTHSEAVKVWEEIASTEKFNKYTGYSDIDIFLDECLDTMRKKGHDYRQGNDDDLLHNFRSVGEQVGEDMMKVWFTYFYKHYSAMVTFIKEGGQSESEPIEGRIKDQIVYLLLFYRMIQEKKTSPIMHHPV
jgi:hypothetical protein